MITQEEFVADCYLDYAARGLEPGNPLDGDWHQCHYPEPKCLGGEEYVWLLVEHHAVQGLLQTVEYNHPCIYGWERHFLPEELLPLFEDWMTKKSKRSAVFGHTEEINQRRAEWNRANLPQRITGTKWWTNGVNNVRQVDCPGEGWWNGRSKDSAAKAANGLRKWIQENPEQASEKGRNNRCGKVKQPTTKEN